METLSRTGKNLLVRLHVQPNAARSQFAGSHGDRLKLRIHAKPVEGEANRAVTHFLAQWAGVAPSQVELVRGASSREKDFLIRFVDEAEASAKQKSLQDLTNP